VKVETLQSLLASALAEKNALTKVRSENVQLREQVELLEERIRESDAEIHAQLQTYTAEVEAFQASLDDLKSGNELNTLQVPVSEMSWDFWSGLLLRIDALMLGDLLTQVGNNLRQTLSFRSFFQIASNISYSFQSVLFSLPLPYLKRSFGNNSAENAFSKRACIKMRLCFSLFV
jgi:hypothetical protein